MYTSYSIEKIASSNRHEALAAAEERRTARAFRATAAGRAAAGVARHRHHPDPPPAPLVRRRRRWTVSSPRAVVLGPVAPRASACHDPVVAAARLIGRDEDVAILRDAVVSARGGDPRCVLVTGEAGIGKSRLVREALTGIDDALVVTGHGADMATGEIPFGVLADTLRDLLHHAGSTHSPLPSERRWPRCCPGRSHRGTSSGCRSSPRSSTCSAAVHRAARSSGWSRTCTGRTLPPATW